MMPIVRSLSNLRENVGVSDPRPTWESNAATRTRGSERGTRGLELGATICDSCRAPQPRPSIWFSAPECTRRLERVRPHPGSGVCHRAGARSEADAAGSIVVSVVPDRGALSWDVLFRTHTLFSSSRSFASCSSAHPSVHPLLLPYIWSFLQSIDSVFRMCARRFALYFRGYGDR